MARRDQRLTEGLAQTCIEQGYRIRRTRSGYVVYGKDGTSTVGWHRTPSDYRWYKNVVADLRRLGVSL